jgi:type 1 glutamine amidotransferase
MRHLLPLLLLAAPLLAQTDGATPEQIKELGFDPHDQSKVKLEEPPPKDFKGKKIVLVAGTKSHAAGDHEFFAGTAILCNLLKQNDVWPVMVRDGWPKDEKVFDGADAIVFYADGRGGHPAVQKERLKLLGEHMEKGAGWVNLHYAVDYDPKPGEVVTGWMGGFYDAKISTNPHWEAKVRELPKHAISSGVKPFAVHDEWYFNMRWVGGGNDVREAKGVTPILQAIPPDDKRGTDDAKLSKGRLETMAWAYDRKDGGRGFGFTGGHTHANWGSEDFRRVVTNAILWAAKADVPKDGAKVEFDAVDLNRNLDKKGKGFKKIVAAK